MNYLTAGQCWQALDGERQAMLLRFERYAALTIPKICYPQNFTPDHTDDQHDYQSLGASCVNHLTNKVMLSTFAPSRPFFRAEAGDSVQADLAAAGMTETDIVSALGQIERQAVKELDSRQQRPKLYTLVRHLIVVGNVLMVLEKDSIRAMGIRTFCVKRNAVGVVQELIIRECVKFDELEENAKAACGGIYQDDAKVEHYRWIKLVGTDYVMTQWVKDHQLPAEEFNGKWPMAKCPYRVLTWDLADESNYGTGLVEEYSGDIEALSILSESVVNGGVLAAELRWMLKPQGMTSAEDWANSRNGSVMPGNPDDATAVQGGNPQALREVSAILERYERRIAMGFLMNSAVTRDAERVTAEEIRMTAQELETAFGGVYSGLAASLQLPIAHWLMAAIKVPKNLDLKISVVTGLEALSRNGDLERLRMALRDLAEITALPPEMQLRIKFKPIADYIGNGYGVNLSDFIKNDEEYAQALQQQQAARVQESNATAAGEAAAQGTVQQ